MSMGLALGGKLGSETLDLLFPDGLVLQLLLLNPQNHPCNF